MSQRVAVIGLGYIGLPTAAILASHGHQVVGVDVNPRHVEAVNRGEVPFVEPDLGTQVAGAVSQGNLSAQADTPAADIYIIAVPTPFKDGYEADLSYIDAATDAIIPHLQGGELIILESTSPPGATQHLADRVTAARPELTTNDAESATNVDVAHCPERVLPGRVMVELVTNDRIVGGLTARAADRAKELYATFCTAEIHVTDAVTAEMAKLTENSFRDVNIAFANELSIISEKLGIDVFELIELANKHPRVNILQPGPGVGGHCIAVDPWFIVSAVPEEAQLIRTAREVNDSKPEYVVNKVLEHIEGKEAPVIAALGLAFKPDIDDMRESPALEITRALAARRADALVLAVEPNVDHLPASLADVTNVELHDLDTALRRADVVALLVDHREFKELAEVDLPKLPWSIHGAHGNAPDARLPIGIYVYLLVTNAYPSSAALYRNAFVHRRVLAYMAEGVEVEVYYLHPPVTKPYSYEHEGVRVHVGSQEHFSEHLSMRFSYEKFLVHFPQEHSVAPLTQFYPETPIIAWVHGFETEAWHRRWFNFVQSSKSIREAVTKRDSYHRGQLDFLAWLFSTQDHQVDIVQISKWFAENISHPDVGEVPQREHVIPNFVDDVLYPFQPKDVSERQKILSIRPYASWKYANDLTVGAIQDLSTKSYFRDLDIRLVGEGTLFNEVTGPVRGMDNVVLQNTFLTQPEIAGLHRQHGIFLAPTRFDSQGVSMCEAMASGLVPITTDVSAISEFVEHGVSGLLARLENAQDLAEYVDLLYRDAEYFAELSFNAAQRVREQCGWEATIGRELELILES